MNDMTPFQMQYYTTTTAISEIPSKKKMQMLSENEIHPTAIIGKKVKIGKGNMIGANVIIQGETTIGDFNVFEPFCSIGNEPEHKDFFGKKNKGLIIGSNNIFREYVTINSGCYMPTTLLDNIIMLRGSHIGHDSLINDSCIIGSNVVIEGHCLLGKSVNIELGSICQKHSQIGSYSLICASTLVSEKTNLNCFGVYSGNPSKYIKENDSAKLKWTYEMVLDICNEFDKMIDFFETKKQ